MAKHLQENVPLAEFTTFGIGGAARWFVNAENTQDIVDAVNASKLLGVPVTIIGGGSNLLIADSGYYGIIIRLVTGNYRFNYETLYADAGCPLMKLIEEGARLGLGGMEKLYGIPGSIGGAVRGNAGAFGVEIKDILDSARAYNTETGETREFSNKACQFDYRTSFFKENPEWVITQVAINLKEEDPEKIRAGMAHTIGERQKRHIQDIRSAGSFFMNPVAPPKVREQFEREKKEEARDRKVPAGWLLERAGCKGVRQGDIMVSEQHPNYFVNTGNGEAVDVCMLAKQVKSTVRKLFGVTLKEEVTMLGF